MFLRSVPTVFFGDASGNFPCSGAAAKRRAPGRRVFPRGIPKRHGRNTTEKHDRNTKSVFRTRVPRPTKVEKPAPPEALLRLAGVAAAPCPAQDGASSGASSAEVRVSSNAGCQGISAGRQIQPSASATGQSPAARRLGEYLRTTAERYDTIPLVGLGTRVRNTGLVFRWCFFVMFRPCFLGGRLGENAVFRGRPLRGRPRNTGNSPRRPQKHGRNTTNKH